MVVEYEGSMLCFFFSSRRRHTRCGRDWSSDVCSSDLIRTWRRGARRRASGDLSGLSEREREIANLIAGGASNPDIAGTLFLSRKTVERHVSNILAKLEVKNRAQLAARMAADGGPR